MYKIAPIEPTEEMVHAGMRQLTFVGVLSQSDVLKRIYQAMLASCQDVESEPVGEFTGNFIGGVNGKATITVRCYNGIPETGTELYTTPQPSKVAELEKHNGLLVDALDHIKRICLGARNPTKRMDWIIARCKSAIVGEEWDKDYAPLPKMQADKEIKELEAKLAKVEADKVRLVEAVDYYFDVRDDHKSNRPEEKCYIDEAYAESEQELRELLAEMGVK